MVKLKNGLKSPFVPFLSGISPFLLDPGFLLTLRMLLLNIAVV